MRRTRHPFLLVVATGLAVSTSALAAQQAASPAQPAAPALSADALPLRAVTLYRSGVGYFERSGVLAGDALVSLRIDKDLVNDMLKSLVLLDKGGGSVSAVGFGSKEPLARRLASFGVNIADNPSVAALLERVRGSRVRLTLADGPVEGTILGVEQRPTAIPAPRTPGGPEAQGATGVIPEFFVNIVTAAGLKSVAISRVSAFELLDAKLAEELNLALAALAGARDERSASIDLAFSGAGERAVAVGYVHETPVWKTSYRLVLPEASESGGAKPVLQGWAIVENTTDEDWREVRLSLASGAPVGFRMDLHEPLFIERPMLPVPTAAIARARIYESIEMPLGADSAEAAVAGLAARAAEQAPQRSRWSAKSGAAPASPMMDQSQVLNRADDLARYAAAGQASGVETGESFRYEISAPVTIERQRSAMLPTLAGPVDGRRVSIYNAGDSREHPMRGVEITNSSGFELAPGPISVFDGAGYAGDAQIGFTSRGQQRLLSYAIDLDVRVLFDAATTEEITKVRIAGGMIEQQSVSRVTSAYRLTNRDGARDRVVIVEQAKRPGWDLKAPQKPSSESEGLNRFEVALAKAAQATLSVVEERTNWSRIGVVGFDLPLLLTYAKNGKASQAVVDAVRKAAELQAGVNDLDAKVERAKSEGASISADQQRIRQNMQAVDRASDLYARYMKALTEQENRIEALNAVLADLQAKRDAAKAALDSYVGSLNVE